MEIPPATAQQTVPPEARRTLRAIVRAHLRDVRGSLVIAVLCMAGFTVTELLAPWPLKLIFDHLLLDREVSPSLGWLAPLLQGEKRTAIVLLASCILGIALLRGLFAYFQSFLTSRIGYELVFRLRQELFAHLQQLSLSFHLRSRTGELLSRVVSDTSALKDIFAESALSFGAHSLTVIGMFLVMFSLNWRMALVVLASFPFLVFALFGVYRRIKATARRQREREGAVASRLHEVLSTQQVVRAFARERLEQERFEDIGARTLAEGIRTARLEAAATRSVELVSAAALCAVVLFGSLQVLQGALLPGEVLIFTAYLTSLYKPLRTLARISSQYSRAMASAERIAAIFEIDPEPLDEETGLVAPALRGEIVFREVCFRYDGTTEGGELTLDRISFTIAAGERVALVGASGAGKSTIASLLLRFYTPQSGSILIDGQPIERYQRASLRRQIGVVLQESILLGASIRENIAYGRPSATDEEVEEAARQAFAHDFITQLPEGYDTILGERGSTLSGGQRQRLCLARAILLRPSLLLLDEPTSAIDAESARLLQASLDRLQRGKTMIVISHQFSGIESFDQILVLRAGRLVETGTHAELLARGGYYAELFHHQQSSHP